MAVETVVLPLSRWVFQWRDDGYWRDLPEGQLADERSGAHVAAADEWARWTGEVAWNARGGGPPGAASWWFVHGELPSGAGEPSVVLADGTRPPVLTVGRIWACEWYGVPQDVDVTVAGEHVVMPLGRGRDYLSSDGPDGAGNPVGPVP